MPDDDTLHGRAATAFTRHPAWSWATLAAAITVLGVGAQGALWAFGFIETKSGAESREIKVRTEWKADVAAVGVELGKVRQDFEAFKASYSRESAGVFLQLLENKVYVARNRVNDCDIMRQKHRSSMTSIEVAACAQYDQDYTEAKRRYETQQTSATQTWRSR